MATTTCFFLFAIALSSPVLSQNISRFPENLTVMDQNFGIAMNVTPLSSTTILPLNPNTSQQLDIRNIKGPSESSDNVSLEFRTSTHPSNQQFNDSTSIYTTPALTAITSQASLQSVSEVPFRVTTMKSFANSTTKEFETTTIDPKGFSEERVHSRQNVSQLNSEVSSSTTANSISGITNSQDTAPIALTNQNASESSSPAGIASTPPATPLTFANPNSTSIQTKEGLPSDTKSTTTPSAENSSSLPAPNLEQDHIIMSQGLYQLCQSPSKSVKCFGDKRNCFKTSNCTFLGVVQESNAAINVSLVTQVYDASKDTINVTILLRRGSKTATPQTRCSATTIDKRELQSDCEKTLALNSTFQLEETLGIKFTVSDNDTTKLTPLGFEHVAPKEPRVRQGRKMNLTSATPKQDEKTLIYSTCSQKQVACFSDKPQCVSDGHCDYLLSIEQTTQTLKVQLLAAIPTNLSQLYMKFVKPQYNDKAPGIHHLKQPCQQLLQEFLIQPYIQLGNTENPVNSSHGGPYFENAVIPTTNLCSESGNITSNLNETHTSTLSINFTENRTIALTKDDVQGNDSGINSTVRNRLRLFSVEPKLLEILSLTSAAACMPSFSILTLVSIILLRLG